MRLHFYTKDNSEYTFDFIIDLMSDEEFDSLNRENNDIDDIINSDEILSLIEESDFVCNLRDSIEPLFDTKTNGSFDWNDKTGEYYDLFEKNISLCICCLEKSSGEIVKQYECEHSDCYYTFSNCKFSFNLPYFYSGNGEPAGAQLALELVECFMEANQWHIGFYDSNNKLITDIRNWSKENELKIDTIKPIVWFGCENDIVECWSITPDTRDLFVNQFWGDYYEGALPYICKADEGLGIYYSVWEYGLEYDSSIFERIKSRCPINLDLPNEDRTNALYNIVISIYNESKANSLPLVERDSYAKDVIECAIVVSNEVFNYSYSKSYKFHLEKLLQLDEEIISDILWEDEDYRGSFCYLEDYIINKCDLSSCKAVWKTVNAVVSRVQNEFNKDLQCQILKGGNILRAVPFSVDLNHSNLHFKKMNNDVFIKSLIEFFKRGRWHIGYKDASELPKTYNACAEVIEQKGAYPIVWFNDSEEIVSKMAIWPAQQQYMLSLTWKNAAAFCSEVFLNIDVHNEYLNNGLPLYKDLEIEFERIKAECPIHIRNEEKPVDYEELKRVVSNDLNSSLC